MAAYVVVNVTGTVLNPNGSGVSGGYIEYALNTIAVVETAGGAHHTLAGKTRVPIGPIGTVDFNIIANNVGVDPAGTEYVAVIRPENGPAFGQRWSVNAAPTSQDIGDILA